MKSRERSSKVLQLLSSRITFLVAAAIAPLSTAVAQTYCSGSANSSSYEWIKTVALGTINNTSNGLRYQNFTSLTAIARKGGSLSYALTPGFSGSSYAETWKIFVDFNRNGLFTDAGEEVVSSRTTGTTPLVGTFSIPSTAAVGVTRLRIAMRYYAAPPACGNFDYGEVEDYSMQIQDADPASPTATPIATSTPTSLPATTPTATATPTSTSIPPVTATPTPTDGGGSGYCPSSAISAVGEWIDALSFGQYINLSNETSHIGYQDFTSQVVPMSRGSEIPARLIPGFSGAPRPERWGVWIDFNQDMDFDEPNEVVFFSSSGTPLPLETTLSVPAAALPGLTRMRVSLSYTQAPAPCTNPANGQVEDYTVKIGDSPAVLDTNFGSLGFATFGEIEIAPRRALVQADGKLLFGGSLTSSQPTYAVIARVMQNGSGDSSFSGAAPGWSFGPSPRVVILDSSGYVQDMLMQPDGKIVALVRISSGGQAIWRINPDGSIDQTFGTGGRTALTAGNMVRLLRLSDGSIVVGGSIYLSVSPYRHRLAAYKLSASGSVVSSFGTPRVVAMPSTVGDVIGTGVFVHKVGADSRILLVGGNSNLLAAGRLLSGGTPDSTFGTNGTAVMNLSETNYPPVVASQSDGKVVAVFSGYNPALSRHLKVLRMKTDGTKDMLFGSNGTLTLDYGERTHRGIALQAGSYNQMVIGAVKLAQSSAELPLMFRLNGNGSVDEHFTPTGPTLPLDSLPTPEFAFDAAGTSMYVLSYTAPYTVTIARYRFTAP